MTRRWRSALIIGVLLALSSCSDGVEVVEGEQEELTTPCQTSPSSDREQEMSADSEDVNRPQAGEYVYDICGLGDTPVREGARLTEQLTASGDVYTIDIRNNLNSNTRRFQLRWEPNRVVQLSNEVVVGGERRACMYRPPLEILHVPIRVENFARQETTEQLCQETVDVLVIGRQSVGDATGTRWPTWRVEIARESGARADRETHWFSPELGRDVRMETSTEESGTTTQTAQLLRSYPS